MTSSPLTPLESTIAKGSILRSVLSLVVMAAVALGVPAYEWHHENWLGKDAGEIKREAVLDGSFANRIANDYADRSYLAAEVRPVYNEMLYLGFDRIIPQVTTGRMDDGTQWLFDSMTLNRFNRADTPELVETLADLLQEFSEQLDRQGTKLLFLPLPIKPTIHDEKLKKPVLRRAVWRPLVAALQERGVWVQDVAEPFDKTKHGLIFNPNNTHWTAETSLRCSEATGKEILAAFDSNPPGPEIFGAVRKGKPSPALGDLGKQLGFRKGSRAEKAIAYPYRFIDGMGSNGQRLTNFDKGQDIVLVGSSFARSYQFGSLLSANIKRPVEDLSDAGLRGIGALARLFREVVAEERPLPKLIVWEFPEKYLIYDSKDVFAYLRDVTATLKVRAFTEWTPTPVTFKVDRANQIEWERLADGAIKGRCTGYDPYFMVTLAKPIPMDGTWHLSYKIQSQRSTRTKVMFDFGHGLKRLEGCVHPVAGKDVETRVVIPIATMDGLTVVGFRIDPVDTKSDFTFRDFAILRKP